MYLDRNDRPIAADQTLAPSPSTRRRDNGSAETGKQNTGNLVEDSASQKAEELPRLHEEESVMSFGFGGAAAQSAGGSARADADLEDVSTEQLGFQSVSGEDKLKLLPSGWPAESQPPASASLLSIASGKGLVAAAGPETLVLAQADKLRQSFREGATGDSGVKSFTADATLAIPRVSQVAFSSDESCLVIAAEQGGGLAVYDTNALTSGGKDAAFQIATNGVSVRQLLPNPNPSDTTAHLFGIVLQSGQLLLADLKARELLKSANGNPVFHENVTCACWSRLGKQVMAGRQDGTAVQIDPQGVVKAEMPRPPQLAGLVDSGAQGHPLTSIYWIETNDFLVVHTPVNPPEASSSDDPPSDDSIYHLASRPSPKSNDWSFQKIIEPTPPGFTGTRKPAHHFIQRLKDWPPNLDDVLFTISTISNEVGMLTKSKTPLDPEKQITGAFTTTLPADIRRAGMPMSVEDGMSDTSPIGMALDFSVKELAQKPIPNEESLNESPIPLPALYVLNNEGMLSIWYIIYNEAIRQQVPFPDLIAAGGPPSLEQKKEGTAASAPSSAGSTGSPFDSMGPPKTSPAPTAASTFGAPSTPAFGGASALGKASPWGAPSAATPPASNSGFGKPAFGSSTTMGGGSGFGQVGGMGLNKASSPWGTPQNSQAPASSVPKFGAASTPFGGNASQQSPFASAFGKKENEQKSGSVFGRNASLASPFTSFSNDNQQKPSTSSVFGGGQPATTFGGLGAQKDNQQSPWGKPSVSAKPSFGSTATLGSGTSGSGFGGSSFGKPSQGPSREETVGDKETPTKPAEQKPEPSKSLFGMPSNSFKLGSTFKGDGSAKDDLPKPKDAGAGFFGGGFGNALGEVGKKPSEPTTPIKKEPGTEVEKNLQDIPAVSTTPASPPKQQPPKQEVDGLAEALKQKPKRFFGDLPPVDVPGGEMPKRVAGDLPPMDVPGGKPKSEPKPEPQQRSLFGEIPTSGIPGNVPPSTITAKQNEIPEVPVAGSPPIDLGGERFSEAAGSEAELPAGPEDDEDEDWDDEEGEEGEGEDGEEDEEDEEDEEPDITDPKALSAFEARLTPASPQATKEQEESTTPATEQKQKPSFTPGYTPAGFPKGGPVFAPPTSKPQESPRSPSPVRSVTAPLSRPTFGQPSRAAPAQPQRIAVPPAPRVERPATPARPAEPTEGELQDEEDARVQAILNSEPEHMLEVPHFLAHQNYVGEAEKPGIGGQIEKVYRDINSMLDTLGLNAHSLQGFVNGNLIKNEDRREIEDLEDEESWTLGEAEQLDDVQMVIGEHLDEGRLEDVKETLDEQREEEKEVSRLRMKIAEARKQIRMHTDEEQKATQLAAPLPMESQAQQSEIRQGVQRVQKLLGQVEEAMSLLRADLATAASAGNQTRGTKAPTVEAVTNTILKMTAMVEQRSGDVDVLESQIKRLPNGIASLNLNEDYEDQLVSGLTGSKLLKGSPYTPGAPRSRVLANGDAPGMNGMLGSSRYRTPPRRLGMSTGSLSGSVRKKMTDVTEQEVQAYNAKTRKRRNVLEALRQGVANKDPRTVKMEG